MTYEEFREAIIGLFKTAHEASYPTILVDYPNRSVVDLDKQKAPWVRVELAFKDNKQLCLGGGSTRVSGWLYIATFVLTDSGTKWQTEYTDFLDTAFSLQVLEDITFREIVPLPGVSYPGWHMVRNVLPFTFEKIQ